MADENVSGQEPGKGNTPTPQEDAAHWKKEAQDHARENQKLRERLNAQEAEKAKAAEDEAKRKGEFERLHAEEKAKREALEAKWTAHQEALKAKLAKRCEGLTDKQRAIVARVADPEAALETAEDLLAENAAGGPPGNQPGSRGQEPYGGYKSEAEFAAKDWRGWKKWKENKPKQ